MRKSEVEIKEVRAMIEEVLEKYPLAGRLIFRTLNWALGEDDDFFEKRKKCSAAGPKRPAR